MKNRKRLCLQFTGYIIKGIADLTMLDNSNAFIPMHNFDTNDIKEKTLLAGLNDAGYGGTVINGAICDIFKNYEGTLVYYKTIEVGKVSERTRDHNVLYV